MFATSPFEFAGDSGPKNAFAYPVRSKIPAGPRRAFFVLTYVEDSAVAVWTPNSPPPSLRWPGFIAAERFTTQKRHESEKKKGRRESESLRRLGEGGIWRVFFGDSFFFFLWVYSDHGAVWLFKRENRFFHYDVDYCTTGEGIIAHVLNNATIMKRIETVSLASLESFSL